MILEEKVKGTSEKSSHPMMNGCAGLFNGLSGGFAGHFLGGKRCKVDPKKWGGRCVCLRRDLYPWLYWVLWLHIIPTSNDPS